VARYENDLHEDIIMYPYVMSYMTQ